jgi:hypothetical protein
MILASLVLLSLQASGQQECEDTDPSCMSWGMQGLCEENPSEMAQLCPMTCRTCGAGGSHHGAFTGAEGGGGGDDLTSVPLMFSGQVDGGGHQGGGSSEEVEAKQGVWPAGEVKIRLYQPSGAAGCYHGKQAAVRFRLSGPIKVPDDALVAVYFDGKELEVLGHSLGEISSVSSSSTVTELLYVLHTSSEPRRCMPCRPPLVRISCLSLPSPLAGCVSKTLRGVSGMPRRVPPSCTQQHSEILSLLPGMEGCNSTRR